MCAWYVWAITSQFQSRIEFQAFSWNCCELTDSCICLRKTLNDLWVFFLQAIWMWTLLVSVSDLNSQMTLMNILSIKCLFRFLVLLKPLVWTTNLLLTPIFWYSCCSIKGFLCILQIFLFILFFQLLKHECPLHWCLCDL